MFPKAMSNIPRHALQKACPQGKDDDWTREKLEDMPEIQNTLQFMTYKGFTDPNALPQMRMPSRVCV